MKNKTKNGRLAHLLYIALALNHRVDDAESFQRFPYLFRGLFRPSPPHVLCFLSQVEAQARISWTPKSIARAHHALSLYALWAAITETALWLFQDWPPKRWAACSRLTAPLDTPCRMGMSRYTVYSSRFPQVHTVEYHLLGSQGTMRICPSQ
jgi:hypothetical protein